MATDFPKEVRSKIMARVASKRNKSTELKLIQIFKSLFIKGWRRNYKLPGKPDFVFPQKRIVVFADGCFWHGYGCRNINPKNNAEYWKNKIDGNRKRDVKITNELKKNGWKVYRFWECDIANGKFPKKFIKLFT